MTSSERSGTCGESIRAEYVDHMGDDMRVARAAWVSTDRTGTDEDVRRLIRYLAKHNHWTPFAHPQITIIEHVPIFVARQRFRHTVGFVYNEESRRYVDREPEFWMPSESGGLRKRGKSIKQGSSDELLPYRMETHDSLVKYAYEEALRAYNMLLQDEGVCPEQARAVLPQGMITRYMVTGSLAAWARAYKLRSDPHAQKEIRQLAEQWDKIIRPLFPISWPALIGEDV